MQHDPLFQTLAVVRDEGAFGVVGAVANLEEVEQALTAFIVFQLAKTQGFLRGVRGLFQGAVARLQGVELVDGVYDLAVGVDDPAAIVLKRRTLAGMNLDRHMDAHKNLFANLVKGDGDLVDKHREFYDEYLAVMDLPAEYYLQTVDQVFVKHALPMGTMTHRGEKVDPSKISRVALMTVEGENDDISGLGQTEATHDLCTAIPRDRRVHYMQKGVGHYGVFNGSRFRSEILPRISDFMVSAEHGMAYGAPRIANAAE